MAGTLPSKNPVSLMIATSAASRSRFAASHAPRWAELDSSSPSNRYLTLIGQPPARREQAAGGHQVGVDLALVVGCAAGQHPVARRRPARTAARSTARADRPAGRRSARRRGPSARPGRGASRRRRPGGRRSRRPRRARGRPRPARRRATGRHAGSRRRARAVPRCSGSAGTPCTTRAARRGSSRGGLRGRRRCQACPAL